MYNSNISINRDGFLVAKTEYTGLVAFYLKKNNICIEKNIMNSIMSIFSKINLIVAFLVLPFFLKIKKVT